jgi:hypothetical protein
MIDSVGFNLWRVSLDPEFFNPNQYLCQAFFSAGFGLGVSRWGWGICQVNRDSSQTGSPEDALYAVTAALRQVIAKLTKNFEITRRLACR